MIERRERLDDLLVQRATEGLDRSETGLLDDLLAEHRGVDAEWVDRLIGEIDAESLIATEERISAELRATIVAAAPNLTPHTHASGTAPGATASTAAAPADATRTVGTDSPPASVSPISAAAPSASTPNPAPDIAPPSRWSWAGWAVAAVMAAIAFGPLADRSAPEPETADVASSTSAFAEVAAFDDAVVASWAAGPDETGAGATGEVVWSAARQEGVMRFRGLAANDPTAFQYQLWIFDAERDERFPVDGGVFDIPADTDEVEVAIQARLPVGEATLFAVTVEEPGGVVVSTRERIATLAELGQ